MTDAPMIDLPGSVETLVIGGGLAGSMAAIELARAGRDVLLIEREPCAHHKVCGEFLSAETLEYLKLAGVSPIALGAAPIGFVRLCAGRKTAEVELPFTALSLSRYVLDEAMLTSAANRGCKAIRGAAVERLAREGSEWNATLSEGRSTRAQTALLANGKHDLRGWARGAGKQTDLVGFKMHWRLAPAQTRELREWMELFLFPGGYGGLSLVEREIANLCFVVKRGTIQKLGGYREVFEAVLGESQGLARRLTGAEPLWSRPLAISPIPYGHLSETADGAWRVGDQFAVIPSFTGDGMAIALHSGAMAAEMILRGQSADAFNTRLGEQLRPGMNIALLLSRAMVSAAGRSLAVPVMKARPAAMQWIATRTRVPQSAMLRA
jgi:flavin-dependent dehydrogenase